MTPASLPTEQYQRQLDSKATRLQTLLSPFQPPALQVFASPRQYYRMRAEFRLWHQGDDLYHIMFQPQHRQRLRVDQFQAASEQINVLMPAMIKGVRHNPLLRDRLFQLDYLTSSNQQALVSMLYHRPLDANWQQQAQELLDQLRKQHPQLHFVGRARKCKIALSRDYVDEQLTVAGKTLIYRQPENSFIQPNVAVNVQMLEWALEVTNSVQGDLLELYCGIGNFSLALARQFHRVLATEIDKTSVAAARYNITVNQLENMQILRMSVEEFSQAMQGARRFNRLQGIELTRYQFSTVLVDPPRAGLDAQTLCLIQAYPHILYISCNPDTLCRDLVMLTQTHRIARLALFDQFPYTPHMESAVWLMAR